MPLKTGMTQAQKLEKIIDYFHDSATCHTLKDLEKSLPAATKVNKMQIKDLLQELTDTNQVNVEKIGSGNWYWAWAGHEAAEKSAVITQLEVEEAALQQSNRELRLELQQYRASYANIQDDAHYQLVLARLNPLQQEVDDLTTESLQWENSVTCGVEGKRSEIQKLQAQAAEVTDNIYTLEDHLRKAAGLDKDGMDQLRIRCYGDNYVEGETLPDVEEVS